MRRLKAIRRWFGRRFGYARLACVALLIGFSALRIADPAPVQELRVRTFDTFQVIEPRQKTARPVTIVDIDEKSLADPRLGQWPWPRTRQTRDAKFLVATKLIQGTSVVGTDANKAFMFHETVVVGLNLLSSFEAMLRNYSNAIDRMNPRTIENAIMDAIYLNAIGGAPGGARVPPPGPTTLAWLQGIMSDTPPRHRRRRRGHDL